MLRKPEAQGTLTAADSADVAEDRELSRASQSEHPLGPTPASRIAIAVSLVIVIVTLIITYAWLFSQVF